MLDTPVIPDSLASHAEATDEERSEWTALVNDPSSGSRTYRWSLDPDCAMGQHDMENWLAGIVRRHGYPIRIHWRRKTGGLLFPEPGSSHTGTLWGNEDAPVEAGFAAVANFQGGEIEHEAVTPIERLLKFVFEQPELAANAFKVMMEPFFNRSEQRDAEMIRLVSEHSAQAAGSAAAAAVEQTLAAMYNKAGFDVDENGEIVGESSEQIEGIDDPDDVIEPVGAAPTADELTSAPDELEAYYDDTAESAPVQSAESINNTKVVAASESDEYATVEVGA